MKTVIVSVKLAYPFDVETEEEAIEEAENVEMPSGYVTDSFDIVEIIG